MSVGARAEHVGSLLRPPYLLEAREAHAAGQLDAAAFKTVEDRAVVEVLEVQHGAGCPVVTDGELRRESFQSEFTAAVDGIAGAGMDAWLWGDWHSAEVGDLHRERPVDLAVVEPLRAHRGMATEEFAFLRGQTDRIAKVTLPSPSLFANLWSPERSTRAYPTLEGFLADVTAILCAEVRELTRLGCRYIQLDAPHYPLLVDPTWRAFYEARAGSAQRWLAQGIELDNTVIAAGRPATFGFHLCRGNQHSRWLVSGGYDAIAAPVFGRIDADRLLLEYDDERSGGFEPLREVPKDMQVVLGLVGTKTPQDPTEDDVAERVREASRLIDPDRLAVGTQCGFASSLRGNAVSTEDQHRKLALMVHAAKRVFGPLRSVRG